jgi:hypothetical protein
MRYCVGGLTTGTGSWFTAVDPTECADCGVLHAGPGAVMLRLAHDSGPPEALCPPCLARGLRAGLVAVDRFTPPPQGAAQ